MVRLPTGVTGDTQNDLIECIDSVIQDQIDEKVQQCTFLSVKVDETTDMSAKEQLSVIIRLDKKDEVVERFLTEMLLLLVQLSKMFLLIMGILFSIN